MRIVHRQSLVPRASMPGGGGGGEVLLASATTFRQRTCVLGVAVRWVVAGCGGRSVLTCVVVCSCSVCH